ncbi:isoprenylcysteine carboxylmethyltransferase family protein [Rhizobiaceae bacterium n13]|uniref:Isoprenylcysteine carboxylmethyltransferase family protein n=1 Tax=Ferirhizobium litorale TaxID=2927786 RepID=A0AAE3Q8J8_9HYPH|nr:isoprenylcysteine carboxylmethyltransferase family protein [Fererhizobium litorale]MDI7861085.1 isoprenylcysteine carboxylmethyltransferase family protein [Fererhizobium litorale]MDI7921232.1 isoprenylcysteine carboxylmethyltransferase family protein [Fererhizobium litorale]
MILTQPALPENSYLHEATETVGLALVILAVFGRLWSILYIGSKKNRELVTTGPYSMTRNPLYFFSLCGLAGIGLIFGSMVLTIAILLAGAIVFYYTARREASYLKSTFGAAYEAYARRTPLIVPYPWRYQSHKEVTFSTAALAKTFLDCLPFLALYPLIELLEYVHAIGYFTPLLQLP